TEVRAVTPDPNRRLLSRKEWMQALFDGNESPGPPGHGLTQRNLDEGYAFEAELFVERDGCQFDMKLHPPVPGAKCSYYHFVDCIARGKPHTATAEEGLIVMELIDAIYASAKKGAPVKITHK
ncbi:hypothetical protein LCGC14_3080960, partial [marine sediment metagenome]